MNKRAAPAAPVLLLAILATACGGGSDTSASGDTAAPPAKDTVVLRDIAFKPEKMRVEVGDTVTWRFEDKGIPHDVTAEDDSFKSETIDSGTFRHTFDRAGTYAYICSLHPVQMKGTVEVR